MNQSIPEAAATSAGHGCSVIVPVLNEAEIIHAFLTHLRKRAPGAEVIVVDGGSRDGTTALAEPLADRVLHAPCGRASQMNAGAAAARGAVLWFLHADSELPPAPFEAMTAALRDPRVTGGCFRLRFPRKEWIYRVSDSLGNLAVDLFRIALGDHGIFCRRAAFVAAGGYRDVPILEDAELYRALRGIGPMRQLRAEIVSSPRRYEQLGPWRTTTYYFAILTLYVIGTPIETLHRLYRKLTEIRIGTASRRTAAVLQPAAAR